MVIFARSQRDMKTTSIREFRSRITELIDSDEPVLVTRHGKNAAVLFPLHDPKKIPLELRRKLFRELTNDIARQLDAKGVTDEDVERAFTSSKKRRRR
jgi:prevent-host-death family protein